jgi:hypothetical protein
VPYLRDHIHTYGTPRPGLGVLLPTVPHASPTQTAGKTNLMNDIGHRFAGLVRAVIDDAQSVDLDDLLLAANAYLAATPPSTVPSKKLSGQDGSCRNGAGRAYDAGSFREAKATYAGLHK